MKFPQFLEIFRPDLYLYDGDTGFLYFLKHWLLTPGIMASFYF